MTLFKIFLSHRYQSLLKPQNPLYLHHIIDSTTLQPHKFPFFINRPITSSPQFEDHVEPEPQGKQNKKPLHVYFKEAVGLLEKTGNSESESDGEMENKELKRKLKQMEGEMRSLKAKSKSKANGVAENEKPEKDKRGSLYFLFKKGPADVEPRKTKERTTKEVKLREPMVVKVLSPDMETFVRHLYKEGYFKDANFAKGKSFDLGWFESEYARGYIKSAAQSFGRDNQEIAKWLSGSNLKRVAMFGCPSIDKAWVIPTKRLRKFFEIPEQTVCGKCMLRQFCKFENQSVWGDHTKNLALADVMKVVTSYALESVHPQLVVPHEIKESVSELLQEVLKLS